MTLFPNYLSDMAAYVECEAFWEDMFNRVMRSIDGPADWTNATGRSLCFGNGRELNPVEAYAEFRSISPVLFKISPSTCKSVRIIHVPTSRTGLEIKMDVHPWMAYDRIVVLQFYTAPTLAAAGLTEQLISTWARKETSLDAMNACIDELYRAGGDVVGW